MINHGICKLRIDSVSGTLAMCQLRGMAVFPLIGCLLVVCTVNIILGVILIGSNNSKMLTERDIVSII